MKLLFTIVGLIPSIALALNFDAPLHYTDPAPDHATAISVGALTEEGILEGNPDGSFRYNRLLNRAEFMQITYRLLDPVFLPEYRLGCFPDVHPDAWFAQAVCQAKEMGIVHGNAQEGVDPSLWYFEPSRPVQYEEAVKVLINIYGIPLDYCIGCIEEWYEVFLRAAERRKLNLNLPPGHQLTRGQVSRLVARFVAFNEGELQELLDAESGIIINGEIKATEEIKVTDAIEDNNSSVPSESSKSSVASIYDSDPDATRRSQFVMLGEDSPALAAIEIFPDSEALDVTKITTIFTSTSDLGSIEALKVYDQDGKYLGRANKDSIAGNRHFTLNMKNGTWVVGHRETVDVYVRAIMNGHKSGGTSGDQFEVEDMQVEGDGVWSNRSYTQGATADFPEFETSQSVITSITNPESSSELLVAGNDLPIGSFKFEGEAASGTPELKVTDIDFTIGAGDGVSVSNVTMGLSGYTDRHTCSIAGSTITCASIPESFGDFEKSAKTLVLYGDVTIPEAADRPTLQIFISQPGNISSAGDVTWTDGTSTFQWVSYGSPVVRGTNYSW